MTTGVFQRIHSVLTALPISERKIAQYILEYPHEVLNQSAQQLGQSTNTSGAAVVRLCKSLGLKGLPDLKVRLAGDLAKNTPTPLGYRDIEPEDKIESIIDKTLQNHIQVIEDTASLLDLAKLKQALYLLNQAETIHVFGVGASGIVAQDAQHKFLRLNKHATAFTDTHMIAMLLANANSSDLLFGISYSGETKEVIDLLILAKKYGLNTIGLSKFGFRTIDNHVDVSLKVSGEYEAVFRSAATASRMAQLFCIDVLFFSLISQDYEPMIKHIDHTRQAVKYLKDRTYK
ncbi:MurR/RpiR family transcriptional regulator [Thermoflavimicrobium daqui]|jgi:DNA-binding MurR/RpiR family transcriptional regulator|uniref:RpiR family transcriptional regulator n=1 Tax=Thermoflavimicrobium daqui TaxID=2137476 RepID=A0A364K5C8_9BACL|nr:MurR/RpiR family transcriptional regulator [Thermoflavimicrobium daqui]RAL24562.1 RpiR family transcriptional regulator [Thermoflavimicrobium daqui]